MSFFCPFLVLFGPFWPFLVLFGPFWPFLVLFLRPYHICIKRYDLFFIFNIFFGNKKNAIFKLKKAIKCYKKLYLSYIFGVEGFYQ